jgi:predicted DNA-binding transcriptional regulator AlpA
MKEETELKTNGGMPIENGISTETAGRNSKTGKFHDFENDPRACDNTKNDRMVTLPEFAKKLNVSTRTVHRLIAAGQFPAPARVGGALRWFPSDIVDYMNELRRARGENIPSREGGAV